MGQGRTAARRGHGGRSGQYEVVAAEGAHDVRAATRRGDPPRAMGGGRHATTNGEAWAALLPLPLEAQRCERSEAYGRDGSDHGWWQLLIKVQWSRFPRTQEPFSKNPGAVFQKPRSRFPNTQEPFCKIPGAVFQNPAAAVEDWERAINTAADRV